MTPAFHLFMPFRGTRRIGGLVGFFLLAGMVGSIWLLSGLDLPKPVKLTLVGGMVLAFLGKEALPMLGPGLASGHGLAISAAGLTVTGKGRSAHWRWDEVSDLRIRSRLHPARLFLGRFISFRVPHDDRRSAPGIRRSLLLGADVVAIGDDYPSRIDDLLWQMEHFRTHAAGDDRRAAPPRPPEALWSFRKDRKKPKRWHLLGVVAGPVVGTGLAMVLIGKFPGSLEEFLDSPGVFGGMIGAASAVPMVLLMLFRFEAKQDNMLVMSAGGLHTRHKIERRHWLWRDIIGLQVKQSASRGIDGAAARIVGFEATHDGSEPGKEAKDGESPVAVSCSIEDTYEMPVDSIAQRARSWWEWSGATFGHAAAASAGNRRAAASVRHADAISFRRHSGTMHGRSSLLDQIVSLLVVSPLLFCSVAMIWMIRTDMDIGLPWWLNLAGVVVLSFGSMIAMMAVIQPGVNRLELTEEGLVHIRYGFKRRWAWHELGSAELRRPRTKWSAKQRSVVTLEAPAAGWTYGLLRWAFNIDNRRLAVIEDIYDSPLDEIVEALNARRRKHGGRAAPRAAE